MKKSQFFIMAAERLLTHFKHSKKELLNLIFTLHSDTKCRQRHRGGGFIKTSKSSQKSFTLFSLSPFDLTLEKIISYCERGLETIGSWKKHLPERRILELQQKVSEDQSKVSLEQKRMYFWVFVVQIGFIVLSVLSIIATSRF